MKLITRSPGLWPALIMLFLSCSAWTSLHYLPHFWATWLPKSIDYNTLTGVFQSSLALSVLGVAVSLISSVMRRLSARYQYHPAWYPLLSRTLTIGIFLITANRISATSGMPPQWQHALHQVIQVVALGTAGWFSFNLIQVGEAFLIQSLPNNSGDSTDTRQRYTYITVIKHILTLLLTVVTIAAMLMSFDRIRAAGTAILASAGVFATIVGFSARGLLESIFNGMQLAVAQSIRLEDTITVNGETGTVTSITLHHVVITLSDRSQLIIPTGDLLNKTFKNWTHSSEDIIGRLLFYINYSMPIEPIRKKFHELLQASESWDKALGEVNVGEFKSNVIELQFVMSAKSGKALAKLRNEIRNKLLEYMQKEHREGLPS